MQESVRLLRGWMDTVDFIRNKAPEGREDVAHGVSRGVGGGTHNPSSPGRAIEDRHLKFFRPSGAERPVWASLPRAGALGYTQSPLRGEEEQHE
jgi:hypothetical protein